MFSFILGRSLIRDARTRRVQKHLHFRVRSRCLQICCSGFPFMIFGRPCPSLSAELSHCLALLLSSPRNPCCSSEISHRWSPCCRYVGERAKDVITSAQSSYLRFDYIPSLLSAVPLACCNVVSSSTATLSCKRVLVLL